MRKRILINLGTLKKGGGQNVGLNFLKALDSVNHENVDFCFVTVKNSDIHLLLKAQGRKHIILMPANPILRMIREVILGAILVKIYKVGLIYTYFGIGLYPKSIPQISGSADSNIYFPEIDFWNQYSGVKKFTKILIDKYRIWGIKRANAVIFENEAMQERSQSLYGISKTVYIKPSISFDLDCEDFHLPLEISNDAYLGLFFCSWQRNKNYIIIPRIAVELKSKGIAFHFILTANPDGSDAHKEFVSLIDELGVQDMISIVGAVKKAQIKSLYEKINVVFLLSRLESFSNNIIESWYFKRTLLIADELWSRSICKDAAVYVDRDDVSAITKALIKITTDDIYVDSIIENGNQMLTQYPSIEQRTDQELQFIKKIYENH